MKIVYGVWLLSIFILPFLQGGYFYHEALFFGVIQGLVLLFLLFKKKVTFKLSGFRWMYLIIIGASLISTFTAIDSGMHFVGVLKLIVPLFFIINIDSFVNIYDKSVVKHIKILYISVATIMVSSLIIVLVFFDSEFFLFEYFVQGTRIGGFFQYANTFGMFIYGSLIILFISELQVRTKVIISILLVNGIMLTQSRGILLVLVLSLLLLALFNSYQLRIVYLLSLLGVGSGQLMLLWIKDHVDVFRGVALLENTSEWLIRLLYYEDSIPMIVNRLSGYGHLGYYYTHQFFQSGASYKVKYLHNSLLQFSLDYGIIAGIALLLIGIYGCTIVYRNFRKDKFINFRDSGIILLVGSLGLFGHTLVDFDFQFTGFVVLYFFVMYLMELKYIENVKDIDGNLLLAKILKIKNQQVSMIIVLIIVICFGYIGSVSYLDYELNSVEAYNMYPGFTDSVDHILKGKTNATTVSQNEKKEIALATVNRNPYYLNGFAFLRDYYYNSGDLESAIKYAKEVYLLAPLRLDYYESYTKITVEHVLNMYASGDEKLQKDNEYLIALLDMDQYVYELGLTRANSYNVKHKVNFQLTEDMIKILNKAKEISNTI